MSFIVRWLEGGMTVVDHRLRIFSKYTAVSTTEDVWAYHPVDEYYKQGADSSIVTKVLNIWNNCLTLSVNINKSLSKDIPSL